MHKVTVKIRNFFVTHRRLWMQAAALAGLVFLLVKWHRSGADISAAGLLRSFGQADVLAVSLLAAAGNWALRIYKWQRAAASVQRLSYGQAACQMLKTFAWSAFTPVNSGEWAGKALFFGRRGKAVWPAVTREQVSQMAVTLSAGVLALGSVHWSPVIWAAALPLPLWWRSGGKWRRWVEMYALSWGRYVFFAGMFSWLMWRFFPEHTWGYWAVQTAAYYLWVSVLPVMSFWTELPVKGSVALWWFGAHGPAAALVPAVILWMWLWHTLLPVLAGQWLHWTQKDCGYV